jgi:3-phosphoshikimate 1-carboxyvinyltransferase
MNERHYPDKLEIVPLTKPPNATIRVPGSKSITNRALVLAALASRQGSCTIEDALHCDDTNVMVDSLRRLGFGVDARWDQENSITIQRNSAELIPNRNADLFVGNSGTSMRFLTAMVSLGHGKFRIDGNDRMRERPISDLLAALRLLGVNCWSELKNGCPPIRVESNGLAGGRTQVRGDSSSQFLSALLMAAPFASSQIEVFVDGQVVSSPFVEMTLNAMFFWGLFAEQSDHEVFRIEPQTPRHWELVRIDADVTSGSYFWGAAAITGGIVGVTGYSVEHIAVQGDMGFLGVLADMGCALNRDWEWNRVFGRPLRGIDVDMNAISDCVPTLAVVACFADGPTTIRNVAHIRHKESDRITALATELRKVGAEVDEFPDGLRITPRPLHGAEIETYNDHRIAMSMALIGLKVPGIVIRNPGCVAKTYPGYWDDLEKLRR